MNKRILALFFIILLCAKVHGATLKSIITKETPDKLRMVISTDKSVTYKVKKGNTFTMINISNLKGKAPIQKSYPSNVLESLRVTEKGNTCEVLASFKYLTSSSVTKLANPNRLVIEFRKISKMQLPKITVSEIEKITTKSTPEKFKIMVYLTSFAPYKLSSMEGGFILELPDTNSIIKSRKIMTKDKLIPKVAIDQVGKTTMISIAQSYPSFYQIYKLENPSRLVIEFDKASKSTVAVKDISSGFRYAKLIKGVDEGPASVNAIFIDQTSLEVFPYLAKKKEGSVNILDTIGSIFTFWMPKEETKYQRDKVSNMVSEAGAIAGINGTFFGKYGEPLGVLMMNGELITYSINDRTALIIDKNDLCYIDNVSLFGEVSIEGVSIEISGINNKRQAGEVVVYTPKYGDHTEEDGPGIILSVVGNEVKNISRSRGWIPNDGYAISLDPSYYTTIGNNMKVGSKVDLSLKILPLSAIPNLEIKHVIGGGPRLLKSGNIYISKNSEKFKSDIAKSRAARTAVGISKQGTLVFVTVDRSKQNKSPGVTLEELAQVMKELGCVDAMNLDGGSSSTMVISSEVVNNPSSGSEISVSNAVLIRK